MFFPFNQFSISVRGTHPTFFWGKSWLKRANVLLADGFDELAHALKINTPHTKTRLSETAVQALAKTGSDWDFAFVSLWIAFNAIYARDLNLKDGQDRVYFRDFLGTVC